MVSLQDYVDSLVYMFTGQNIWFTGFINNLSEAIRWMMIGLSGIIEVVREEGFPSCGVLTVALGMLYLS